MRQAGPSLSEWLAGLDDWLVGAAEHIVWDAREKLRGASEAPVEKAIEVIQRSQGSLRVFRNWVRYQWAREKSAELWSVQTDSGTVAERIVRVVEQIEQKAGTAMSSPDQRRQAVMQATARFLGYFKRALKALEVEGLFEQIQPALEEAEP